MTPKAKFIALGIYTALPLFVQSARGEPNDEAAKKLANDAINVDYLATDFAKAKAKLDKALALCSKEGACSAKLVAIIHRDIGVVYVTGLANAAEGKKHFESALAIDPTITLDKDLTTRDIQAVFDEAKAEIGNDSTASAAPKPAPAAETPPSAEKPPAGEIVHQPPIEQAVLTPVPVYVELPEGVVATKVTVRYKPFGADWKTVEAQRRKDGYGAEIPCLDVGNTTGNLEYFIVASDASGDVVAFGGTRNQPYRVAIKHELSGEPPHLPGKPPPAQCQDTSDCPPGFPGCMSGDKGVEDKQDPGGPAGKKNWISLAFQQDILVLSSSKTACSDGSDYSCFYENPTQYLRTNPVGTGNEIAGGVGPGTQRILLGFDRVFGQNIAAGVRVGYAFSGGPQAPDGAAFLPFHGELRGSYFFTPLGRLGFHPFVHLSGGIAQVDARVTVPLYTPDKPTELQRLAAWKKAGTGFIGAGVGLMYAIWPRMGPYIDVQILQLLGVSGTSISPQMGYAVGF